MTGARREAIIDRERLVGGIRLKRLIAIIRNVPAELVEQVGTALVEGGIRFIEVTLNRDDAYEGIQRLAARAPEIYVGAGTVLRNEQLIRAADAGAEYIISPHCDVALIRETRARGLVSIPGAYTPTEMQQAHAAGAEFVKLFPAAQAGCDYIRAVRAPLPDIRLLAVGGVSLDNLESFLEAGICGFGIGSDLVSAARLERAQAAGSSELTAELQAIEARARSYVSSIARWIQAGGAR